jgi:hypothetical protein
MICLFGLSLAELQLFTSQSYNTSNLELAESYLELNWPRTPTELSTRTETGFMWNSLYNRRTDHTENIFVYIVETCVLSHCITTVAALTIATPLLLRCPATTSKHSFLYCCVHFRGFYGCNSYRMEETLHSIVTCKCRRIWCFWNEIPINFF